jgi:hypothetical protein
MKNVLFFVNVLHIEIEKGAKEFKEFKEFLRKDVFNFFYNDAGELVYIAKDLKTVLNFDEDKTNTWTNVLKNTALKETLELIKKGRLLAQKGDYYYNIFFNDKAKKKMREGRENLMTDLLKLRQDVEKAKENEKLLKEKQKENEKLLKEIESLKKGTKVGRFKKSLHLTEQTLKYKYKDIQPGLFDTVEDNAIKTKLVTYGITAEGIKLTNSESKVIDSLCKILHEKSQNLDPNKKGYYLGNEGFEIVNYGGQNTGAPKLAFTLYEITKEYKGGDAIGGKDVETVKKIIEDLSEKNFFISYLETRKGKDINGREIRIENKIEEVVPLIKILKLSQTKSSGDVQLSKVEEVLIKLNPIFNRHIDSRFITVPNDITKRTVLAYGSHNLSEITIKLRDLLLKEKSYKHATYNIGLDKFYYLLGEKYMRASRRTQLKTHIDKAIKTVTAMGLLEKYEIVTGATGESKIILTLNKNWE